MAVETVVIAAVFALLSNQGGHILQSSTLVKSEEPAQFPNVKQVALQFPEINFEQFLSKAKSKPESKAEGEPEKPEGDPDNENPSATKGDANELLREFLRFDIEHTDAFKLNYFTPDLAQALKLTKYEIFWKNATKLKAQENKQELFIQFLESIIREIESDEREKYLL